MVLQVGMMAGGVVMWLVTAVIGIFINALFLMISTKLFKINDTSYKTALIVAAITGVIGIVLSFVPLPFIGLILMWALALYLVRHFYKLDWGKAALVWLVWFVISLLIAVIIWAIMTGMMIGGGI